MGMTLMVHYATLCTVSTGVSWLVISIVKVLVVMAAGGGSYLWLKYWDDNASSEEDGAANSTSICTNFSPIWSISHP